MNKKIKLKGRLGLFYYWSIIMLIGLTFLNVGVYFYDGKSGAIVSIFLLIGAIATGIVHKLNGQYILQEVVGFATEYSTVQKKLLNEMEIPYVLLDHSAKVMWADRKSVV